MGQKKGGHHDHGTAESESYNSQGTHYYHHSWHDPQGHPLDHRKPGYHHHGCNATRRSHANTAGLVESLLQVIRLHACTPPHVSP